MRDNFCLIAVVFLHFVLHVGSRRRAWIWMGFTSWYAVYFMCHRMCYLLSISFYTLDCAFILGLEFAFQSRSVRYQGGIGLEFAPQARALCWLAQCHPCWFCCLSPPCVFIGVQVIWWTSVTPTISRIAAMLMGFWIFSCFWLYVHGFFDAFAHLVRFCCLDAHGFFHFSCFWWYAHWFVDAFAYLVRFCCYAHGFFIFSCFWWHAHGFLDAFPHLARACF